MTHGERLTEYTSFELQTLLDAVANRIVILNEEVGVNDALEALDQWSVKIIEARSQGPRN